MPTYRRVQEIEREIGPDGSLVLGVIAADVRLTAVPGGLARIQATFELRAASDATADEAFEASKLRVQSGAGSLRVEERDDHGGLAGAVSHLLGGTGVELESVEVEAPSGCRLEVRAVSGDVNATGFQGNQRFQTVSGDLRLIDVGGDLNVDSVSGDVSLRANDSVALRVHAVSGDLSAEAPSFRQLKAQTVSGDVSVEGELEPAMAHAVDTVSGDFLLESAGGVTIEIRGFSTDVRSALPHRLEGSADRRRLVVGDGAASLAFNSMSGDLTVSASRQSAAGQAVLPAAVPETTAPSSGEPQIDVLSALERGEIDVDEAIRRLGGDRG